MCLILLISDTINQLLDLRLATKYVLEWEKSVNFVNIVLPLSINFGGGYVTIVGVNLSASVLCDTKMSLSLLSSLSPVPSSTNMGDSVKSRKAYS